jgi:hypothetical protein
MLELRSSRRACLTFAHVRLQTSRSWGGGEAGEKTLAQVVYGPADFLDPRTLPSEIIVAPTVAFHLLA